MWPFRRFSAELDVPFSECAFLALDLETTGLRPETDQIVAAGWVPVERGEVVLAGARSVLVGTSAPLGESVTIHGLTDEKLADAPPLAEVLPNLLEALDGRVLVCHYATLEVGFLSRAVPGLKMTYVDTLALERRLTANRNGEVAPGSLRLDAARRRHGLPAYAAHDALTDALGAAELFLAQAAEVAERVRQVPTLRDLGGRVAR